MGCPRNKKFFVLVRTNTNRNSICFGSVSVFLAKLKKNVGCQVFRNHFKTNRNKISAFRNKPKLLCNGHGRGHGHGHFLFLFFSLFRRVFGCFGCIETSKRAVSILKRNNRNTHLVSDSAETSFGSRFGYIETKLVL